MDEFFGNFIVQALEDGGDASTFKTLVACFVTLDEVFGLTALYGFGKNGIGIIVVEDEDIVVSAARDKWEASREVIAYESFQIIKLEDGGADFVGAVHMGARWFKGVGFFRIQFWWSINRMR